MKVSEHISKLLLTNAQIEVKGFGIFVKSYKPAEIHPVEHRFKPPSCDVVFNPGQSVSSCLLRDELAKAEGISLESAEKEIENFVEDINKRLSEGNRVHIPPLGTLKIELTGSFVLDLNPELNLNPASAGLPEFVSPSIQRREAIKEAPKIAKRRKLSPSIWIPCAGILFLAILSLAAYKTGLFDLKKPVQKVLVSQNITNQPHVEKPIKPATEVKQDTMVSESVKDVTEETSAETDTGDWFILAACFSSQKNAEKYLSKLISEGHPASMQGQTQLGLYRVCYRSFATEEAAVAALPAIRSANPNAYIVKLR